MQNYFEKIHSIDFNLVDSENRYSIVGMQTHMQDAVCDHTALMGVGSVALHEKSNAFWVVLKSRLRICGTRPEGGSRVKVKTYPLKPSLVRCFRVCEYRTGGGELFAVCDSEWCLLDGATLRPRRVSSACYPLELEHVNTYSIDEPLKTFRVEFADSEFCYERTIRYSELDVNNHTNNIAYTRFALDTFTSAELKAKSIAVLEINFESQSFEGEILRMYKKQTAGNAYLIGGYSSTDKRGVFLCEIVFA